MIGDGPPVEDEDVVVRTGSEDAVAVGAGGGGETVRTASTAVFGADDRTLVDGARREAA